MIAFQIDDMTCGHCVSTITKAVRAVDRQARLTVDLDKHLVMVEPTEADPQDIRSAITEAGYSPVPVQATPTLSSAPAPAGRACCGGCR